MFWSGLILCVLLVLSAFGYEIEEHALDIPEYGSVEYHDDIILAVLDLQETDHDNFMSSQDTVEGESKEDISVTDGSTSFAGPVKAKGTVSMAATFGYDSTSNYPSTSSFSASWPPPGVFPQFFFPSSPQFTLSTPIFSPIPLLSMFLPGISSTPFPEHTLENLLKNAESEPHSKDIFLELKPLRREDIDDDAEDSDVEILSSEEEPNPVVFIDDDFTDYDEVGADLEVSADEEDYDDAGRPSSDHLSLRESSVDGGVFGGFVPAKGTVRIAARF